MTVHKGQSLTLDEVVVHCSQEFVPGQTYVALSRVKQESSLQVIGFQRKFLLPPPTKLGRLDTAREGNPVPDYTCCKFRVFDETFFESMLNEDEWQDDDSVDDPSVYENDSDWLHNAKQYFESNEGIIVNLKDVLLCMTDCKEELSAPPSNFNVQAFLKSITEDTQEGSNYNQATRSSAMYGSSNLGLFELLVRILWCRIAGLFKDYLPEHLDEVHMTSKDFTCAATKLHQLFLTQEYRSDIVRLVYGSGSKWTMVKEVLLRSFFSACTNCMPLS